MNGNKPATVDEYISLFDKDVQQRLHQIRKTIMTQFHGVEEKISYNMPAYTYNGATVYFSAYKNHIGLYPIYGSSSEKGVIEKYRGKNTKDSLHFKHAEALPIELIADLINQKFKKPRRKK